MSPKLLAVISVFVGGLVGTALRLGLDQLLPHATGSSFGWFASAPLSGEVFLPSGGPPAAGYVALTDVVVGGASIAWSTVVVNLVGSLVLGFLVARLWRLPSTPAWLKTGLGTGLLGSFTTFSAIAVNVVDSVSLGNIGVAFAALGLSLVGGILAAWAGLALGGWHAGISQTARTRRMLDAIPDAIPDKGVDQ
jgi:CrcB protein